MASSPVTRQGSAHPADIYLSVGVALSWWEASEDILMGLFRWLCATSEPVAFEAYVAASRSARGKMLLSALTRYHDHFQPQELIDIRAAVKALDKLSPMRNQIAHGHVSHQRRTSDDILIMDGNFLVPSLNEAGHQTERDIRYAHTAEEIDNWRDRVRAEREKIMDAEGAARKRAQDSRMAMSAEDQRTLALAEAIVQKRTPISAFSIVRRPESE